MTVFRRRTFDIVVLSAAFALATSVSLDARAAKKKKGGKGKGAEATQVEPKEPTPQAAAREHYNKGKELYDQGKFAESLAEFQAAYDAKPHPTVLKSIAECLVQMGDVPEAVATLEKYLADETSTDRAAVEKRLAELKATPVKLSISSSLEGTKFTISGVDGEFTAPYDVELTQDMYEVTFTAEGYEPLVKSVTLELGHPVQLAADFATEGVPKAAPEPLPVEATPVEEEPAPPAPEVKEDNGPPVAFWAMAAVAGVGLISGTVFGTMALSMEDDYKADPTPAKKESGQRDALIADVSFGVAAAAAIAGTVVFVVNKKKSKHAESARVTVLPVASPNEVGVGASIRF